MQVQACNIATTSSDVLQVWSDNLIKKDLIKHIKARHRVEISPKFLENKCDFENCMFSYVKHVEKISEQEIVTP